jgi:N-acyl amino acid synthase of PEP-CTERM/exosortase system
MFPGSLQLITKHIESENGPEILNESFRLRYRIYCEEANFLNKDDYPSGIEVDKYDPYSDHIVSLNQQYDTNNTVGTVRLVRYSDELGFPTAEHYEKLYRLLSNINAREVCEISRLCISKDFRKRVEPRDGLYGVESYLEEDKYERRKYPVILLHLFRKMHAVSRQSGINYWIASMEETLSRVLGMYAIKFQYLSDDVIEYYGRVRLYIAEIPTIEERMSVQRPDLYPFFKT